jgi:hypothetical protein
VLAAGASPVRGVYIGDFAELVAPGALSTVFRAGGTVPAPNNTNEGFIEFPSVPRIDMFKPTVVTRGQSRPVYLYTVDGLETRAGTSGVYVERNGAQVTGASLLGAVPGSSPNTLAFPWFQVPGTIPGTRFDQFPGAPGIAGSTIVFKGNWTDSTSIGRTGVYFRNLKYPEQPTVLVADSATTKIPGSETIFGSTAPPSAARGWMVFAGSDNEDAPTLGGLYRARLDAAQRLQTLVRIGGAVPNERGRDSAATFTRFGEGLSFDGRFVSFWAAWGEDTRERVLQCPTDGNRAIIEYCWSSTTEAGTPGTTIVNVPVHQGLFVYDTKRSRAVRIAALGDAYNDFLFWTYSGRPPGTGDAGDEDTEDSLEPPRWRSSAFTAVRGTRSGVADVAFKALGPTNTPALYLTHARATGATVAETLVAAGNPASLLDANTTVTTTTPLLITNVGLERDGYRGGDADEDDSFLAITASMANADASVTWAGVYMTRFSSDDDDDDDDDDDSQD